MPKCNFCGKDIAKGTGTLYVQKDGTAYWYCAKKCEKNVHLLKRRSGKTKWTAAYHKQKEVMHRSK